MPYSYVLFLLIVYPTVAVFGACSSYTTCKECSSQANCGWCASSSTCQEGTLAGPHNDTSACGEGNCWSFANETCPEDCSSMNTCSDCTANSNCGWCGTTRTCLLTINSYYSSSNISIPCGSTCGNPLSTSSCWKFVNAKGRNQNGNCPVIENCGLLTNCKDCTNSSCFWCASSQTCMESTAFGGIVPCPYKNQTCEENGCFKGGKGGIFGYCPETGVCSTSTDCFSCASRSECGWCFKTQTCVEISNFDYACAGNCTSGAGGCFMRSAGFCPSENNHTVECSSFNGNCEGCHGANCGYCVDTGMCLTSIGPQICGNQTCNDFRHQYQECSPSATGSASHTPGTDHNMAIIGGVVGGIVGIAVIAGIAVLVVRYRKRKYTPIK